MKIEFSFLNESKSFIGFGIERGGYPTHDEDMEPVVQRTIEMSLGFLFGWMTVSLDFGGRFKINDIFDSLLDKIEKENRRGNLK